MIAARVQGCRHIRLYAILALLAIGRFPDPLHAAPAPAALMHPFRSRDWDLAWQAFVGAGEVEDAYALSRSAVRAQPHSRLWLARLAQAARWSNHPQDALAALSRLALDLHDDRYLQPALDLAIGLGDDDHAVALLRELIRIGRASPAQQRMLSGLYLSIGEPQAAIRELQRQFARTAAPDLLWQQAVIYRAIGDPARELDTLQRYRRRYGSGPRVMLAIATIEYVRGQLPQALDALMAARSSARRSDTAYWATLSGLAWLLGRYPAAAQASQVLIDTHKAEVSDYERVLYAERYRHPRRALAVAEQGWRQTHEPALFLSALGIACSQPSIPVLAGTFALLDPRSAAAFTGEPSYWTCLAQLRAGEGRDGAALAAYRHALLLNPGDDNLLAGYLWLLIDSDDLAPLAPNLYRLDRRASRAPELWAPMAAAYAALDEPQRALPWLQAQWPARKADPLWLMSYADTLEQADRPHAAWRLRKRAYDLIARHFGSLPGRRQTQDRLQELARLAAALAPGDPARRAIEGLARHPRSQQARVTVMAWMLGQQAYPLARWWSLRAFLRAPAPHWAQLAQAMARNDRAATARLLEQDARLPRRDRVAAAAGLGWSSLAATLAYDGLVGEPDDAGLQQQFDDLAVARADSLEAAATQSQWSGLRTDDAQLQASHWLAALDRLEIRVDTARQRAVDDTQLGVVPSRSRSALLAWEHTTELGSLTFDLGAGRNLTAWSREGVAWQERWSGRVETNLAAVAGARPLDTAALSVAGLEDRLAADASAQWTPRTTLQLQLQAGRLRAQGGGNLGTVQRFSLEGDYRLWFAPPDLALQASLSGAHYDRAANVPAPLLPLLPADRAASVTFFVPDSFVQVCGGAHFNTRYESEFTARLRLYADADLCANSVSGQGYDLTAGSAMPLFGSDQLSLSLNIQSNVGTHSGRTTVAMLRYRHYFTPTH